MCRPVLTGTLLCQLDFIWRGIIGVDREIAVIYAVAFSAADHSCAEADEKNRLHRVSGPLYKVRFICVRLQFNKNLWLESHRTAPPAHFQHGSEPDYPHSHRSFPTVTVVAGRSKL